MSAKPFDAKAKSRLIAAMGTKQFWSSRQCADLISVDNPDPISIFLADKFGGHKMERREIDYSGRDVPLPRPIYEYRILPGMKFNFIDKPPRTPKTALAQKKAASASQSTGQAVTAPMPRPLKQRATKKPAAESAQKPAAPSALTRHVETALQSGPAMPITHPEPSLVQLGFEDAAVNFLKRIFVRAFRESLPEIMATLGAATQPELQTVRAVAAPALTPPPHGKHSPEMISEPRKTKPKVLIAGLINAQISEIQREYQDVFDLRFFRSDSSQKALSKLLPSVDMVFGMTNFLSHSADNILKRKPNYVRVPGLMTELRAQLDAYFKKGAA